MADDTSTHAVRPRPGLFRALGDDAPPEQIDVAGQTCQRLAILKHDSFAATALYQGRDGKIIAKFNRMAPIFGLPMRWLGRALARRESTVLDRLHGIEGIPRSAGPVRVAGLPAPHATAHHYIEGHPLAGGERVDDAFFPTLVDLLRQVHARGVAHVDLNKRENIIVGDDGKPNLIDYQIHFALPRRWPGNSWPMRVVLRLLQRSDDYHLLKHRVRLRPDQMPEGQRDMDALRPWWIRGWRCIATPWRQGRRRLLVALHVRSGEGRAESEHEPEAAFRGGGDSQTPSSHG
ncbi:MAG: hypothetical protein WD534_02225 [Phycisphaeraceae bacterium]